MHLKDYYQILKIEPSATLQEIKRAYRKLAHQYHPDKTGDDKYAAAHYAEIKEAYEVLVNPSLKYFYHQQRWYEQSTGKRKRPQYITPVDILQQVLELERYVAKLDVFRMDKVGLSNFMKELLSDEFINKLIEYNDPEINISIIDSILRSAKVLPVSYFIDIKIRLQKLAASDVAILKRLDDFENSQIKNQLNEYFSIVLIVIVTIFICLLIWYAADN